MTAACDALIEAGLETPTFFARRITGNEFLRALMWSQGRSPMEGGDFMLGTTEALRAPRTLDQLFERRDRPDLGTGESQARLTSGEAGMMFWSACSVGSVEPAKGDLAFAGDEFPGVGEPPAGPPTGGDGPC